MKILTLSYEFPPLGGGGSQVVAGLARELARRGHRVDLVTMGFEGLPEVEDVDGARVVRVPCGRASRSRCTAREAARYVFAARAHVERLLGAGGYDLVHSHFLIPDGLLAWWQAAGHGIPYLVTAHGSDVPGYNPKRFFRIAHAILGPLWKRVAQGAGAIVSPSRGLAGLIRNSAGEANVTVIPNGIDLDRFRPRPKRKRILVATRFVERKGVQHVLRAVSEFESDYELLIVGDGEYAGTLRALNDKLGQPAKFVGWLDNGSAEYRDYLETSSIYVLPSDYENFPVCLLEAMAAGNAIVTTRGHGCEEVVGDAAEFVRSGAEDPGACVSGLRSTLERLTRDPSRCAELGRRARLRLEERFGWPVVAGAYEDLYREHARNSAGRPAKPVGSATRR